MFKVVGFSFIAAILAVFFLGGRRLRNTVEFAAERLGSQLSQSQPTGAVIDIPSASARGALSNRPDRIEQLELEEKSEFHGLNRDSIVALLSDCYWCEEDSYAAWIWNQCSLSQKSEILKEWKHAEGYVRALARTEKSNEGFHHHPYYLRPLALFDVSQADVTEWVKKYPGAWHFLSPLRQARLPVSLKEKMGFGGLKPVERIPALPGASRMVRVLRSPVEIGAVTFDDELSIFENPETVPAEVREEIVSLVWVALLDKEKREELLSQMTAQNLAEAWVGPDEILAKLEEVLPERKMALVRDYLKNVKSDRSSPAMRFLVREALAKAKPDSEGLVGEQAKAA